MPVDPKDYPVEKAEEIQNQKDNPTGTQSTDDSGTDDNTTVEDLRKRAAELEIEGRSSMNKEELQDAIAKAEQG